MARVILDSGALIALSQREARIRAMVERAQRDRHLIVVPAPVVAETTRGGPQDASVNRILKAIGEIASVTETTARTAGRLLADSGLSGATVDALIAAEAVLDGASVILTGDPDDMTALAGRHHHVRVYDITSG